MTTQPELPEVALPARAARPALRLAPLPAEPDLDFDAFVRSYEARLRRLVLRRIGDLCEAEEITQETLLRAYQHRASFSSEDELMAWSTVVAQRLVIDRVRVRGRSVAVADVPETARLGRDTADIVVARHEARAALESLEAIPTRQAAILWAREVEGLHYEEIAERFGITEPAVRSLLHRGRKALRKEFKDRTGSLPLNGLVPFAPWLLALKAAGRVRGAAKSMGKAAGTGAMALSLSALVVTGIGGFVGGNGAQPRDVRIAASAGGATHVTGLATEPAVALEKVGLTLNPSNAHRWLARRPARSGPGNAADLGPVSVHHQTCVAHAGHNAFCGSIEKYPDSDSVIAVHLPENPVAPGVTVATDHVDCASTGLPSSGPVTCTEHPGRENGDDTTEVPLPPLPAPSVEGADR